MVFLNIIQLSRLMPFAAAKQFPKAQLALGLFIVAEIKRDCYSQFMTDGSVTVASTRLCCA